MGQLRLIHTQPRLGNRPGFGEGGADIEERLLQAPRRCGILGNGIEIVDVLAQLLGLLCVDFGLSLLRQFIRRFGRCCIGLAEFEKTLAPKRTIFFAGLFKPQNLSEDRVEDFQSLWDEMKGKILHRTMGI